MLRRQVLGLLLVTHPLPSALYVIATAILAWLAAATLHTQPAAGSLVLALLAVGGAQIAIGSLNDYCDRHLDAEGQRREKPLVSGLIAPWEALALCTVATLITILALIPLGPVPLVLGLFIEGLGLAYDLRFKGTPFSAVLFAVYFPLFPLFAWAIFGHWQPFLLWLVPFGSRSRNRHEHLQHAAGPGVRPRCRYARTAASLRSSRGDLHWPGDCRSWCWQACGCSTSPAWSRHTASAWLSPPPEDCTRPRCRRRSISGIPLRQRFA